MTEDGKNQAKSSQIRVNQGKKMRGANQVHNQKLETKNQKRSLQPRLTGVNRRKRAKRQKLEVTQSNSKNYE